MKIAVVFVAVCVGKQLLAFINSAI